MWSGSQRSYNYGLGVGPDMGMVGLRDVFVVAPASSFNPNSHHHDPNLISDPHSLNASNPATALGVGVGVGVIPLLTAGPCLAQPSIGMDENSRGGGGIQLWQQNQHYLKKSSTSSFDHHHHHHHNGLAQNQNGGIGVGGGMASSSSSATTTCQDCGNQAKKDCNHGRCRTCCRSRGFNCTTHVKSTWVPAARRRERQLMATTATATVAAGSSGSTSGAKKPRLVASQTTSHTSTSNTTPPRSFDTTSSHQDACFKDTLPGQIRAPAVFKCVRVTAVDDGDDEYAYQAVVKIGGHVFKGFLYDQGAEAGDAFPNVSELHLGDVNGAGAGGGSRNNQNGASSSSPLVDPSDVYNNAAGSGGGVPGFLGGSTYGLFKGSSAVFGLSNDFRRAV